MAGNTVAQRKDYIPNITMEGVRIVFKNFSGKAGKMNAEGDRNFCVILEDPELVKAMEEDGWNVKYLKPREEGDDPQPYLKVKVKFHDDESRRQPNVVIITSRGRTRLGPDEVGILDWAEIANVDLIVTPYKWTLKSGKTGVSAYVKSLFITIREDELEQKYANVPDSAISAIGGRENNLQITDGRVDEDEIILDGDAVWED